MTTKGLRERNHYRVSRRPCSLIYLLNDDVISSLILLITACEFEWMRFRHDFRMKNESGFLVTEPCDHMTNMVTNMVTALQWSRTQRLWSSGMIPVLGTGGPEFNSWKPPPSFSFVPFLFFVAGSTNRSLFWGPCDQHLYIRLKITTIRSFT